MADGTRRVAVTSERAFTADDGKVRTLQLASWFSIDYSDSSASGPVILRIFLPDVYKRQCWDSIACEMILGCWGEAPFPEKLLPPQPRRNGTPPFP